MIESKCIQREKTNKEYPETRFGQSWSRAKGMYSRPKVLARDGWINLLGKHTDNYKIAK